MAPKHGEYLEVQVTGHHEASEKSQQTGNLSNHTPNEAANQGCSQDSQEYEIEDVHNLSKKSPLSVVRGPLCRRNGA